VVGEVYFDLGLYREARTYLTEAVRSARPGERPEELAAADALTQLGHLARAGGDWAASCARYREALARKRRWLGEDALSLAEDYNGLGLVVLERHEPSGATLLFRRTL